METSAGVPLISTRPFAVTKWSAWLVSKESPVSQAPSPVILKSATISYRTPCRRLGTDSIQKTPTFTKNLYSQYYGKSKQTCRNVKWGCNGWPVSCHEPLDTMPPPFRETGQQGDLLTNLMLHVFTYSWFEITWK